jgi:hypothetical protein
MSSPKAPPPAPDPNLTIQAATKANTANAVTNFGLNAVDQNTPFGSLKYNQTGTWADGTPKYEANTSLTPELSGIVNNQISRLGSTYGTPFDLNSNISTQLSDQATKLLDPIWKQRNRNLIPSWRTKALLPVQRLIPMPAVILATSATAPIRPPHWLDGHRLNKRR